jgi:trehalose 6-phosphate phosphatase
LTLSLHNRSAEDPDRARAELERVAERARAQGLHARFGRMVLELLPPLAADKGTAVRELMRRAGVSRALFAGDDTTDLDAFDAVDELELGIKVAVDSAEAPQALLDGPPGLVRLLQQL